MTDFLTDSTVDIFAECFAGFASSPYGYRGFFLADDFNRLRFEAEENGETILLTFLTELGAKTAVVPVPALPFPLRFRVILASMSALPNDLAFSQLVVVNFFLRVFLEKD